MILADTSVWINFLRKSDPDTVDMLKAYLKNDHVYAISAVFGELLQGVKSKRERSLVTTLWENLPKVEEQQLFIKAGELSNQHKLYAQGVGLVDCYILAAAIDNNLALWTLDKKLQNAIDIIESE